jgi:exopolyphosphatase/guanosine-5'-triphosphate,3'-diphosphate pyrophosphatase
MTADNDTASVLRPLELDPKKGGRLDRPPYGIIDIGSNSVRVVIYDQLGRAPLPRFNEKSLCRLADGLAETGVIAEDNFHRAVEALRRFRAIADAMGVTRLDATATEAVRRAGNGKDLIQAIRAEAGVDVRILTGAEEARFAALGVISGFFRPVGVVGDMGGGSLELSEALDDRVGDQWVSLPLGALPIETIMQREGDEAKDRIDALLAKEVPSSLANHPTFYAVGGGWRSFAKAHMQAMEAPVQVVHGYRISAREARAFAKSLLRMSPEKMMEHGISRRRTRTMPAAALLLNRLLKHLAPEHVVFSALGLREGWLYSQLPDYERYLDPLVEGAQLIGLPAARVPEFAQALVSWTDNVHKNEQPADIRLRVALCALSDLGWRDHPDIRAEESFRRVLQFPFIGVNHAERAFLALAIHARYAGELDASYLSEVLKLLPAAAHRRAQVLGRAILLAYRLSGGIPLVLASSRLSIGAKRLRLEVARAARVPDSESVSDRLALLAEALGSKSPEICELSERD